MLATALTTLDLAVLGLCALFALRGAWKGFVWQLVRLLALLGALWGASAWDGWLAPRLDSWIPVLPDAAVPFVAWGVIFVGLMLVGAYIAHMARGLIHSAQLGGLDRLAGFVLGAATGLAFATLLLLVGGALADAFEQRTLLEDALRGSHTPEAMNKVAELLEPLLPEGVRAVWNDARAGVGG